MAAIVAPGVCRFVVHGTYSEQPVINVLDMFVETTGTIIDREQALFDQAGIIINEWSDSILPHLSNKYSADSVSWVDLDALDASTGERSQTDEETWSKFGAITAATMPGNVAYRIEKRTVAKRGERQGRMYLCGMSEAATSPEQPNEVFSGTQDQINDSLESFLGDINQDDEDPINIQYGSDLVVVHTKDGVYTGHSKVTGLTCSNRVASQRRRLTL